MRAPEVVAFATDAAHAGGVHDQARGLLPDCRELHALLERWESADSGMFLIVLAPLDTAFNIRVFIAEGRGALRRQVLRAAHSLKGARTAWVRGLDDPDDSIVMGALGEICEHVAPFTLADVEAEGTA